MVWTTAMVLFVGMCITASNAATTVKGVSPDIANSYDPSSGTFRCLTSNEVIPFSQVNDNYCDCVDGSDEPGTSACPNGKFFCVNAGFTGIFIPSSLVGDGLCDCCDGSDEADGVCENTCDATAKAAADARRIAQEVFDAGRVIREQWVRDAASVKVELKQQLVIAMEEEATAQAAVDAKQKELDESIAADKAAHEAEQAATGNTGTGSATPPATLEDPDDVLSKSLHIYDMSAAELRSLLIEHVRATGTSKQLVMLIRERLSPKSVVDVASDGSAAAYIEDEDDFPMPPEYTGPSVEWNDPLANAKLDHDDNTPKRSEKTVALQNEIDALRSTLRLKQSARNTLESNVEADYGPDGEFYKLKDQCFETTVQKYTYKMCPYSRATQDHTSLGNWEGFKFDYNKMEFAGGQSCWNGPQRSLTVTLACGSANELTQVEEPSTCKYTAVFKTPAACNNSSEKNI